jgi:hypothetical protein
VRADRTDTIGEFDFLLNDGDHLVHIEFATKFYLLDANSTSADFNGLIGPNLADSLGAKMRKIFDSSLRWPAIRPRKPAAAAGARAQALVKGWLFYPNGVRRCRHHPTALPRLLDDASAGARPAGAAVRHHAAPALAGAVENAGGIGKPQLLAALQTPPRRSWSRR